MGTPTITLKQVFDLNAEKAKRLSSDNLLTFLSGLPVCDVSPEIDWEVTKKGITVSVSIPRCLGEVTETITWELKKK
jgi:hypothetical protein